MPTDGFVIASRITALLKEPQKGYYTPAAFYTRPELQLSNGKPDRTAIDIVTCCLYYYKLKMDANQAPRTRFKSDLLQLSFKDLAQQFGGTERQYREAAGRLHHKGIIKLHYRNLKLHYTNSGHTAVKPNVTYFEPVPEAFELLLQTHHTKGETFTPARVTALPELMRKAPTYFYTVLARGHQVLSGVHHPGAKNLPPQTRKDSHREIETNRLEPFEHLETPASASSLTLEREGAQGQFYDDTLGRWVDLQQLFAMPGDVPLQREGPLTPECENNPDLDQHPRDPVVVKPSAGNGTREMPEVVNPASGSDHDDSFFVSSLKETNTQREVKGLLESTFKALLPVLLEENPSRRHWFSLPLQEVEALVAQGKALSGPGQAKPVTHIKLLLDERILKRPIQAYLNETTHGSLQIHNIHDSRKIFKKILLDYDSNNSLANFPEHATILSMIKAAERLLSAQSKEDIWEIEQDFMEQSAKHSNALPASPGQNPTENHPSSPDGRSVETMSHARREELLRELTQSLKFLQPRTTARN